ncbi:hypothetical protein ACIRU3_38765 [Streptomyces sp. NPDC101151]|uniref:hypothetical protein n=1 Tax=Streptomyces sp. NPDC101151 TaxID=3366115 RepID=UPI00381336E4
MTEIRNFACLGPCPVSTLRLRLPCAPKAPVIARRAVRAMFPESAEFEVAVLIVSELVAHAVDHGVPSIVLRVTRHCDRVRISVGDGRPAANGRAARVALEITRESGPRHGCR